MLVKNIADFKKVQELKQFNIKQEVAMKAAFMVSPVGFSLNEQTAQDNDYMQMDESVDEKLAVFQQMQLARTLTDFGIPVVTFPGSEDTPDAVFPNNAFATNHNRRYIVGSMKYPNRQLETQRRDIRKFFGGVLGYEEYEIENHRAIAELTGVMVPDRGRNVGFVGMTERVDEAGAVELDEGFQLDLTFQFDLAEGEYHTNVVMACLASVGCVIHKDSFADPDVVQAIDDFYEGRILYLSDEEKMAFCGNCISITDRDVLFSQTAFDTLSVSSRKILNNWGLDIHGVDVSELEKAGGSLRCMIGEIF
ncbi:arginine deiminase-related protein [Marinicella sp. S1101]|uniref:arginine deiminase-related protein n=1 Tax=Marinicella marina TaxID=2996016 RepID=UPI002260BDA4|nr:arginine deiminase-related protein [Marinicella marina]MCX7554580.1 arginine deiminase-related protein [Marinicella marina]MDJ1141036.1 arginine deiminase-related protein [Marinicella marina]